MLAACWLRAFTDIFVRCRTRSYNGTGAQRPLRFVRRPGTLPARHHRSGGAICPSTCASTRAQCRFHRTLCEFHSIEVAIDGSRLLSENEKAEPSDCWPDINTSQSLYSKVPHCDFEGQILMLSLWPRRSAIQRFRLPQESAENSRWPRHGAAWLTLQIPIQSTRAHIYSARTG